MSGTRVCNSCDKMLPDSEFYQYNSFVGGRRLARTYSQCRGCKQTNRNRICNADPAQFIKRAVQQLKSSRRRRDPHISFDVTPESVFKMYQDQGARCALSGILMENYRDGSGVKNPFNISIDRKQSYMDYSEENVQLVCQAINIMKGTMEDEQFIRLCQSVALHSGGRGE